MVHTEKPDSNKCRKLHIILGYFGIDATKFQPNIIIIICRKIVLSSFGIVLFVSVCAIPLTYLRLFSLVAVLLLIKTQTQRNIANNSKDHNMAVELWLWLFVLSTFCERAGSKAYPIMNLLKIPFLNFVQFQFERIGNIAHCILAQSFGINKC